MTDPPQSTSIRVLAGLRLGYIELQYWLLGLTPEDYHSAMARAWEDWGNLERTAHHLSAYLGYSEDTQIRALLAYCRSRQGAWQQAAGEYATVIEKWPHPSMILGLAEAKLNLGDLQAARELSEQVAREHSPMEPYVQEAYDYLRGLFDQASNPARETASIWERRG